MATKFALCELKVSMSDGVLVTFWFDGNSKVTLNNSTFDKPAANAFSLVHIKDCPFATEICKSVCYVNKLEKAEKEVYGKYVSNSEAIRLVLSRPDYLATVVAAFANYIRQNCADGFRWHISGDIFSLGYAEFIREVCMSVSDVPFWIYTRSFSYLEPLVDIPNLVVNLSADKDNLIEAMIHAVVYNLRICYMTVDDEIPNVLADDSVIFPSYNRRYRGEHLFRASGIFWFNYGLLARERRMICPADFFGQSEHFRCGVCKKCLKKVGSLASR